MKFEAWLFRRMAEILESGEWEIKYKKNLKDIYYSRGKRIVEPVWGLIDNEKDIIFIDYSEEQENDPEKGSILFHELTHIIFEDYFSKNKIRQKEEDFILTIEGVFYKTITKKQKLYLESFLPKTAPQTKIKKSKKSR